MNYLQYFFNPSHLFSVRPPAMSGRAALILVIIFGIMIAVGLFSNVTSNKTKDGLKSKGYKKIFYLGMTIGLLGFVYLFFAVEGIPLLSSRVVLLILGTIGLVWAGFITKYMQVDVPKSREKIIAKRDFEKYIP